MISLPPQDLPSRPRRNRRSSTFRSAMSETHISPANFILPVFVHEGDRNEPIASMPGVSRLTWRKGLVETVREARSLGVNQVVIFPKVRAWGGRDRMHACVSRSPTQLLCPTSSGLQAIVQS
jgi:delta-aminolevulinic acid dehydratase/porphobilinogen synthase